MTIQECYKIMEANYDDVIRRLGSEERVKRFLGKLPRDDSFRNLTQALEEKRYEEAFRAVHSLKGICLNLGLTKLYASSDALTELLRDGQMKDEAQVPILFERVKEDYTKAVELIEQLTGEGESIG